MLSINPAMRIFPNESASIPLEMTATPAPFSFSIIFMGRNLQTMGEFGNGKERIQPTTPRISAPYRSALLSPTP